MANKEALRELQQRLAERLQTVRQQAPSRGWLAVEIAGHGFLLPLDQSGEIFPLATIHPVPHSADWFLGVANLRGQLHGLTRFRDFARASVEPDVARGQLGRRVARRTADQCAQASDQQLDQGFGEERVLRGAFFLPQGPLSR